MSGLSDKGDIPFPLDNVRSDSMYGVRVLTHYPPADYTDYDSENPQVRDNELMRPVAISNYYPLDELTWNDETEAFELGVTDFETRDWKFFTITEEKINDALNGLGVTVEIDDNGNVKAVKGAKEAPITVFLWRPYHVSAA